jgi:hypothetical protein
MNKLSTRDRREMSTIVNHSVPILMNTTSLRDKAKICLRCVSAGNVALTVG